VKLRWIAHVRETDPDLAQGLVAPSEHAAQFAHKASEARAIADEMAARSGWPMITSMAGDMMGYMTEPISLITLPTSRTILGAAARTAALNTGIEVASIPDRAQWRHAMGLKYGMSEAAADVFFASVGGGVLGGVGKAVAKGVDATLDAFSKRFWPDAAAYREVADDPKMPGEIREAAETMARAAEIDETAPVPEPTRTEVKAHRTNLQETQDAIKQGREPEYTLPDRFKAVAGRRASSSERVRLADGTFDQFTIDGTDRSARQAAAARGERIRPGVAQKGLEDGLFEDPAVRTQQDIFSERAPEVRVAPEDMDAAKSFMEDIAFYRQATQKPHKVTKTKKGPKNPILAYFKRRGGIDPDTPEAGDLRSMGITSRTRPGLFRKRDLNVHSSTYKRRAAFDNIEPETFQLQTGIEPKLDEQGYVDKSWIMEAMRDEFFGQSKLYSEPEVKTKRQIKDEKLDEKLSDIDKQAYHLGIDIDDPNLSVNDVAQAIAKNKLDEAVFNLTGGSFLSVSDIKAEVLNRLKGQSKNGQNLFFSYLDDPWRSLREKIRKELSGVPLNDEGAARTAILRAIERSSPDEKAELYKLGSIVLSRRGFRDEATLNADIDRYLRGDVRVEVRKDPYSGELYEAVGIEYKQEKPVDARIMPTVQRLRKQVYDGVMSYEDAFKELMAKADNREFSNKTRAFLAKDRDRVYDPRYVKERLLREDRHGTIDASLALWFIEKAPNIINDLGISVRSSKARERGPSGFYDSVENIVHIMNDMFWRDRKTVLHEILHHTELMLPSNIKKAIYKEWARQAKTAIDALRGKEKLKDFVSYVDGLLSGKVATDDLQMKAANALINEKIMHSHYQYMNASEFWAVNATNIINEKFKIRKSIVKKIRNWLKEFAETLKSLFGMKSHASIINGIKNLHKNKGELTSANMLTGLGVKHAYNFDEQSEILIKKIIDEINNGTDIDIAIEKTIRSSVDQSDNIQNRITDQETSFAEEEDFYKTANDIEDFAEQGLDDAPPPLSDANQEALDTILRDIESRDYIADLETRAREYPNDMVPLEETGEMRFADAVDIVRENKKVADAITFCRIR